MVCSLYAVDEDGSNTLSTYLRGVESLFGVLTDAHEGRPYYTERAWYTVVYSRDAPRGRPSVSTASSHDCALALVPISS